LAEYTQDAMAYVRLYGRPDLFITFTCNPNWPEIKEYLMPGQTANDRYDLISRVFRHKLVKLMELIEKHMVFGPIRMLHVPHRMAETRPPSCTHADLVEE